MGSSNEPRPIAWQIASPEFGPMITTRISSAKQLRRVGITVTPLYAHPSDEADLLEHVRILREDMGRIASMTQHRSGHHSSDVRQRCHEIACAALKATLSDAGAEP